MRLTGCNVIVAGLLSAKISTPDAVVAAVRAELESAGASVVGVVIQRRGVSRDTRPGGAHRMNVPLSPKTFIGEGKARELGQLCSSTGADLVVFLNPLSQRQKETLARITNVRIQDVKSLRLRNPTLE